MFCLSLGFNFYVPRDLHCLLTNGLHAGLLWLQIVNLVEVFESQFDSAFNPVVSDLVRNILVAFFIRLIHSFFPDSLSA